MAHSRKKKDDMASVLATKPHVGFATGIIFGLLGMLLVAVDAAPGIALWMFRIVGCFLLFVALSSILMAAKSFWRNAALKRRQEGR